MSRVLIIGASGGIGLATVEAALKAGHAVRAFARGADGIALRHEALERFPGDALNPDDMAAALKDVDAVILALGVPNRALGRRVTLFSRATQVLLPAMEGAGARRLIAVTGFGAGDSRSSLSCLERAPFRLALGRAYDDKDRQEALIRESDLDWTLVRPTILTNGPKRKGYRVMLAPESWRNGVISRASVADFLVRAVDDPALVREAPVLANR